MNVDNTIAIIGKLLASNLPELGIILAYISIFVLSPLFKRISGLSSYIKRFLALQQRRAKATEQLSLAILKLCEYVKTD